MKISGLIVFMALLLGPAYSAYCAETNIVTQVDGEIPKNVRGIIYKINNKLFESIKNNKPNVMINMFVEEGRSDARLENSITDTYQQINTIAKGANFELLHEYFIDSRAEGQFTVTVPGDGKHKLNIGVDGSKGPAFISLLTSSGNFRDLALSFVYIKGKQGWHLYTFHCGLYKVAGKSPVQWYEEASSMYKKGWVMPAMQRIQFAESFIRPAPFLQYAMEKEMADFFKNCSAEAAKKYKFPFKASWVKGAPQIYGLDVQFVRDRLVPVVVYVTKYPLDRGVPIQEEADAITSKLGGVIPGITECSDELAYKAFTEPPLDAKKDYKYRSLASKIK